jgi:hypothetical protein
VYQCIYGLFNDSVSNSNESVVVDNEYQGSSCGLFMVILVFRICLERLRNTTENLRIVGVAAGIRTGHLLNKSHKRYCLVRGHVIISLNNIRTKDSDCTEYTLVDTLSSTIGMNL